MKTKKYRSEQAPERERSYVSYSKKTFGTDNHIFNLINNDNFSTAIKIEAEVIFGLVLGVMMNGKRIQFQNEKRDFS